MMKHEEDFRTPGDARGHQRPAPFFDDHSAQTAAPVVPLGEVARRRSVAPGDWRERMRSPRFRRSWPLALLLVATLAAGGVATNLYQRHDSAQQPATAADDATPEAARDTTQTDGARKPVALPARGVVNDSARRDDAPSAGAEDFAARAPGNFADGEGDEGGVRDGRGVASKVDKKTRRAGRAKGRRKAKRVDGGALLFDVIRD